MSSGDSFDRTRESLAECFMMFVPAFRRVWFRLLNRHFLARISNQLEIGMVCWRHFRAFTSTEKMHICFVDLVRSISYKWWALSLHLILRLLVFWSLLVRLSYRYDAHSGGEREIQRTMLELLNQLDGFDARGDVKVILATNRIESLDPALLRPGRIDRKIEFPLPDIKTRRRIFQVFNPSLQIQGTQWVLHVFLTSFL